MIIAVIPKRNARIDQYRNIPFQWTNQNDYQNSIENFGYILSKWSFKGECCKSISFGCRAKPTFFNKSNCSRNLLRLSKLQFEVTFSLLCCNEFQP